jgi:RHS repeat-associated protein
MHGITGQLFRKIAFNGLPIPDEKPQAKEETDAENEQSYVDVFDLIVRHSVSDVYVPLPGNELTLTVQRVLTSEIWGTHPGLKPWELPNRPFGPCWDSNLCPHIRFGFLVTDKPAQPDWVDVVDENGTSYRFVLIWQRPEPENSEDPPLPPEPFFLPMPSNRTEQDNYLTSLRVVAGDPVELVDGAVEPGKVIESMKTWKFEFRRKFGTLLRFDKTAVYRSYRTSAGDPPPPPGVDPVQHYFYARLTEVEDRFDNLLTYELDGTDEEGRDLRVDGASGGLALTLLPSRIVSSLTSSSIQKRTITIISEPIPLPSEYSGEPADPEDTADPKNWVLSLRRVVRVIAPRGHDAAGAVLNTTQDGKGDGHRIEYEYASPGEPVAFPPPIRYTTDAAGLPVSQPVYFQPLRKVLRPEGMISQYGWENVAQQDGSPRGDGDPQQWFFHTNLSVLLDGASIGYQFEYQHNLTQKAYNGNPSQSPMGWYTKTGLRMYIATITLPGGHRSTWMPTALPSGIDPALLEPEPVVPGISANPVLRTVYDAAGERRRWVFDEHHLFYSSEIQALLYPSEDLQRNMQWLLLWTRCTIIHPLMKDPVDPNDPPRNLTETANYNEQAGLATKRLSDFCDNVTTWDHDDGWDVADVTGLGWLGAIVPEGWFFTKYPDPTLQTNALSGTREFEYVGENPNELFSRVMKKVTDEEGRVTLYDIDEATGNRTKEEILAPPAPEEPATVLVRETQFEYHTTFLAFLTKRTTKDGILFHDAGDPGVGSPVDQDEEFEPDDMGYTAKEVRGLEIVDGQFSRATHEYDFNGNRTKTTDGIGHITDFSYDKANRLTRALFRRPEEEEGGNPWKSIGYDLRGNKTSDTDELGNETRFLYDGENRLLRATRIMEDPDPTDDVSADLVTSHLYNPVGSRIQTTDPNGNISRTFYDEIQRPIASMVWADPSQTPPPGTAMEAQAAHAYVTRYEYDRDENCGSTAFDTAGFKPTRIIHPKKIGPEGEQQFATSEFEFDELYRNLIERHEYQPGVFAETTREYNATGTVHKETDPEDLETTFTYDAENRPLSTTWENENFPGQTATVSKSYTPSGLEIETINERGAKTALRYDLAGRVSHTLAADPVTGLITEDSPVTDSLYTPSNNLVRTRNPLVQSWHYVYDFRNRRTREILPEAIDAGAPGFPSVSAELVTVHDDAGNVIGNKDARGNTTVTEYDQANRPIKVMAPAAEVYGEASLLTGITASLLDNNGNVLSVTDPNGNVTENEYDGLNRLVKTTTWPSEGVSIVNTFTYDEANNRISVTDGELHTTKFEYDGLNRLTKTIFDADTLHENVIEEVWGPLLKEERIEEENRTTTYTYDFRHRLKLVSYDTNHTENRAYDYDPAGNLLKVEHPHAPDAPNSLADTSQGYDFLNRVLWETSAGHTHHYEYDKAGNRTLTTYSGSRALTCAYDNLNRLSTCTEQHPTSGEPERITRYLYDRDGRTLFKALPGGTVEESTWDTRGRSLIQDTSAPPVAPGTLLWPGTAAWTAAGTGVTGTLTFPGTRGAYITKHLYEYDNAGNVRRIFEESPSGGTPGMDLPDREIVNTYDGTYRLCHERIHTWTPSLTEANTWYGYDKAGNRISKTTDGGEFTEYQYGEPTEATGPLAGPSNQVRVIILPALENNPTLQFAYNAWGCRSHRWANVGGDPLLDTPPETGVDTFTWDRENRLISSNIVTASPADITPRTNGAYTFRYDHRTRRLWRQSPSASALITFSGGLSVQEYNPSSSSSSGSSSSSSSSSSNPTVEYIRGSDYGGGIGGILYTIRAGQARCQHYNSRGDIVAKSDATAEAAVTWAAAYLAFGTRPEEVGTNPDPQRANTKEEDGTGLLNEGHRYRCLETGMFVSRDPAGFVDGPNLYAYVEQNPWSSFDPEGLDSVPGGTYRPPQRTNHNTAPVPNEKKKATVHRVFIDKGKLRAVQLTAKQIAQLNGRKVNVFINGIQNPPLKAAELAAQHYHMQVDPSVKEVYLVHNPTEKAARDILETAGQKLSGTSQISRSAFSIIKNFDLTKSKIIGHSQGGVILSNVLEMVQKARIPASGLELEYHGSAANSFVAHRKAANVGATISRFAGAPTDAVHQIVGFNAFTRGRPHYAPLSVAAAPLLATGRSTSPHSYDRFLPGESAGFYRIDGSENE